MFRVNNKKEFEKILKMISEEAVALSREALESDKYVEKYQLKKKKDEKRYGKLSKREYNSVNEEEEEASPEEEEEEEEEEEQAPKPKEKKAEAEAFGVSFDSIISAINDLRAGRSLKDSVIKDQASAYYDRLDENERKVLLIFLKELSKILAGTVKGSEAQDPGDAPFKLVIQKGEEEAEIPDEEEEAEIPDEDEEEEEDTSPPIKVNEVQDMTLLRKKVRRLMRG